MIPTIKPFYTQHLCWEKLKDDVTRFPVFGGAAGGGKSWLGCEWIVTMCYQYPGTKYFIGRNELKRIMSSTFVSFKKVCSHHEIPSTDWKLNSKYNFIDFISGPAKGSRIDLLDVAFKPSDPMFERFGSTEYTSGWLEEAGEINFLAFDVLKSRINRHLNRQFNIPAKLLITCNPKKNWIYKDVYKPWRNNTLPKEFAFIQSFYQDNPYTAEDYGKSLATIRDKSLKERLMHGNWEYENEDNILMKYENITDLYTNTLDFIDEKYISVDVARFGQDSTVILLWQGMEVIKCKTLKKCGTDRVATEIRTMAKNEHVPYSHIVIDEIGVGGGVVDQLDGVKGFVSNSAAIDLEDDEDSAGINKNFYHLRDQCYYKVADLITNHNMAVKGLSPVQQEMLTEELEVVKAIDVEKDAPLRVTMKKDIKDTLNRSPDFADCVMMRMWFELNNKDHGDYMEVVTTGRTMNNLNAAI